MSSIGMLVVCNRFLFADGRSEGATGGVGMLQVGAGGPAEVGRIFSAAGRMNLLLQFLFFKRFLKK